MTIFPPPESAMSTLQLRAADGTTLSAYLVKPAGTPRGAVVVIQEIFGVNSHIRRVAEQYAAEGYLAIAPAMFDRRQKGVDLGYDSAGMQAGIELMMKASNEGALPPTQRSALRTRVSVWWATLGAGDVPGWLPHVLRACLLRGGITQLLPETPRCPMLLHFGERDSHIPAADVEKIRHAFPRVPIT
jgi:carboxymethylenebutenolidase